MQDDLPTKQVKLEDPYEIDEFLQLTLEEVNYESFVLTNITLNKVFFVFFFFR